MIHRDRLLMLAGFLLTLTLAGCGERLHPVGGKVTLEDGTPLRKGLVVFESVDQTHMARGTIRADGSYQLSKQRTDDGLPAGRYRVLVSALDLTDVPDEKKKLPFDTRYTRLETSGLEVEVKAGKNDIPIQLAPPHRRKS